MATQHVTISLNANNHPTASPDTVSVNAGDTIVWSLTGNLHWPANWGSSIVPVPGSVNLLNSPLQLVNGTLQGTVVSNATPGAVESYDASVVNPSDEDVVLSTHSDIDTFDPKIKVNPKV